MVRAHPTIKAGAAAARYGSLLSDPLHHLAEEVGKAVAAEVEVLSGRPGLRGSGKTTPARKQALVGEPELVAHITALVAKLLRRTLSSPTAEGKALRMALIAALANTEIEGEGTAAPITSSAAPGDTLLTTAEAATKLEVSRPYVSMLCDAGKLGKVVVTKGGHRRIRAPAVEAYLAARVKQFEGAPSPREAGVAVGLYDHPEGHFQNKIREAETAKLMKSSSGGRGRGARRR
ncbi:helix-turn-helix domain-containing protein [Burkholderia pseudomallei]|uniref:helix-turn-helix domain-containing protein n=1 Tax=Burkholderia pseudomallei TaxID=28450 RepID=UPI000537FFFF|nr:helix-turn-helix domain-containing protein [Burkholderia pseudomallei]KGX39705.1 DNA binding, excisionase family domain protein [Burkholderia pseudomallei MSHR2138]KGX47864.1 DNA binding, excisionase family domain protein [Burkholderia pseudomallei MSHR3709]